MIKKIFSICVTINRGTFTTCILYVTFQLWSLSITKCWNWKLRKHVFTCKIDLERTHGEYLLNSLKASCNKQAYQDYCSSITCPLPPPNNCLKDWSPSQRFILDACPFISQCKQKHSGSIPRNACVACETAMLDYQESVTTEQTDKRQTKWSLCTTMLCRWHKKCTWILIFMLKWQITPKKSKKLN